MRKTKKIKKKELKNKFNPDIPTRVKIILFRLTNNPHMRKCNANVTSKRHDYVKEKEFSRFVMDILKLFLGMITILFNLSLE